MFLRLNQGKGTFQMFKSISSLKVWNLDLKDEEICDKDALKETVIKIYRSLLKEEFQFYLNKNKG